MLNYYDAINRNYNKSHLKPDKQYSMLPTILRIAMPLKNKVVIDVGCGDGFFSNYFSEKAKKVYGIDNSIEQIKIAKKKNPNIEFIFGDMLEIDYPKSDIINAPFVLCYIKEDELNILFKKFYDSLNKKGKILGLIDYPKRSIHDNKKFGSIKRIVGTELKEGSEMIVDLYNGEEKIVSLHSYYHTKETIEKTLNKCGFSNIRWHKPVISKEGVKKYGRYFWAEYLKDCDVVYFSAVK